MKTLFFYALLNIAVPFIALTSTGFVNDVDYCFKSNVHDVKVDTSQHPINDDYTNNLNCNNWLSTPFNPSYVDIGDLDVPGDKITVEAVINRTEPYLPGTGDYNDGDIVSKHTNPTNVNYLLRPNHAYITTTNGFFATPDVCEIELNKTYHVALVYDGTTLKFYRNGFLMSQIAASGNLYQNNFPTRIAHYTDIILENFIGYVNEVRIWNVARTQSEIQTYMASSLSSPTTQPGLLAYYIFDNLLNKQGNPAWNGTLGGGASINTTNTSCTLSIDSCAINTCDGWLSTSSYPSYVQIGDLDVPGNKITVEAKINRTQPYLPGGGDNSEGDIVSKHHDPPDVNYLLRPNHAYITTTNGFFGTPDVCEIELNKTYHVAMVYDGTTLKYYRDGYLLSQVNASGNLVQNNLNAQIGLYPNPAYTSQFLGYIDEVRIWNVARSQNDIRTYMNSSLPDPANQTGLLAYYTFDDLLNKQGNSVWDGTSFGAAIVNATNTACEFIPDSCNTIIPVSITNFNTSVIDNKKIQLQWTTENELNIKNYIIQRATSGLFNDFVTIGNVVPVGSSGSNRYSYIDNTAKPNVLYYYKIVVMDIDESRKETSVKTAKIVNKNLYTLMYPNPTKNSVQIIINNTSEPSTIRLMNNLGQTISVKKTEHIGSDQVSLDLSKLASGVYWVTIESGEFISTEKIVKQ